MAPGCQGLVSNSSNKARARVVGLTEPEDRPAMHRRLGVRAGDPDEGRNTGVVRYHPPLVPYIEIRRREHDCRGVTNRAVAATRDEDGAIREKGCSMRFAPRRHAGRRGAHSSRRIEHLRPGSRAGFRQRGVQCFRLLRPRERATKLSPAATQVAAGLLSTRGVDVTVARTRRRLSASSQRL